MGTTVAGSTSDPGPWSYQLSSPTSITSDAHGYMYIMDFSNNRIQKWYPGAAYGFTMAASTMSNPYGMTMDSSGNFYVADTSYHRVQFFGLTCRMYLIISVVSHKVSFDYFFLSHLHHHDHGITKFVNHLQSILSILKPMSLISSSESVHLSYRRLESNCHHISRSHVQCRFNGHTTLLSKRH